VKWYRLNARNRFVFAVRNPGYALKALARGFVSADERFLAAHTGSRVSEIRRFMREPVEDLAFLGHLQRSQRRLREQEIHSADPFAKKVRIQYAILRALRPQVVVETGVANGVSTAFLLHALHRNGAGTLHSIELGDARYLPAGTSPGWLVPEGSRDRWKLHLGDARALLPSLLSELGTVDLFIHDSLHTYEHMMFEFQQAYPYLRAGGFLLADDALWNDSFRDFAGKIDSGNWAILRGVGVLKK